MDLSTQTYLTLAEAALYLRTSPAAFQKLMERKVIPVWTWSRLGRTYRFLRPALDEWQQEKYRAKRKGKSAA